VYFTFAVDLAQSAGLPSTSGPLLWATIGAFGAIAVATGGVVRRLGLRSLGVALVVLMSLSLVALSLASSSTSWPAHLIVAAGFGAAYMTAAAVLAIWSAEAFPDRPATGHTWAIAISAAGSIAGPALVGSLASMISLPSAILAVGAITFVAGIPVLLERDDRR
jgi:predicted MFS family arabinose efflux permease